jgi:hypothetical protein
MNVSEARIATFTWGAAYLINDHLNVVVDKGSRMNKAELTEVAKANGLAILKTVKSLNQFGWKSYSYSIKAVA